MQSNILRQSLSSRAYASLVGFVITFAAIAGLSTTLAYSNIPTEALIKAAYDDNPQEVERLLRAGADPNAIDKTTATTALYEAKNVNTLKKLIQYGAKVNQRRPTDGCTALARGVLRKSEEKVRYLLKNGADPNLPCDNSYPISLAASRGLPRITRLLIAAHSKVNVLDDFGRSPLHSIAISVGKDTPRSDLIETARELLNAHANVHLLSKDGEPPLVTAAAYGFPEMIELLIRHGANPDYYGTWHYSPIVTAAMSKSVDAAEVLLKHGAFVNEISESGATALDYAEIARTKDPRMYDLLRRFGAKTTAELFVEQRR